MQKDFSKLRIWRDVTINYTAGIAGALVIAFSLENSNIEPKVFWIYLPILYIIALGFSFFITHIFRNSE